MNTFYKTALIASAILFVFACKKEKASEFKAEEPADCSNISFASDVLPIFQNKCAFSGCHSTASNADGVALDSHAKVIAVNDNRLKGSIKHETPFKSMPQGGSKLPQTDIDKIICWMNNGKPNN